MGNEEVDIISVAQKPEKKTSLLERYNIPLEYLSYEFISGCNDGKTLERIVLILRSGEEGVYPDLTKHAEKRLISIKPTSAVLRKAEPVLRRNMLNADERQEIDDDISNWTCEMQSREKDLDKGKTVLNNDSSAQPNIREIKVDIDKKTKNNEKKQPNKRISSCDYAAWDKYDVDTEINRIDLQDEQRQAEMKRIQERQKELKKMNRMTHKATVNKSSLTGTEINVIAEQEREKGNEAFKAADYEEALRHYNASIEIESNLNAYNNRAMTFIKLKRYEKALNDCNTVLTMDYKNVKALLRRALSLEHLEKAYEALADYEAVLKLEPTNKTAISGVNKLRKPCEKSRKIRMNIEEEENISVDEGKAKREVKSEMRTVETNGIKCPKQRVNNDICYCDRAPGPSQSVATKPHLKASYCVETDSNKAAAVNKSSGKTTRGNKLSPVAKDFGSGNKTPKSYLEDAFRSDDIFTIARESFHKQRGAEGRLEKSIFSCISSNKIKPSTVIIEELSSDEVSEMPKKIIKPDEKKSEAKKKTSLIEEKSTSTKKSCVNKTKELISLGKESRTKTNLTPNKIQIVNECEKPRKSTDTSETRMEIKKKTTPKEEKDTLMKRSDLDKNKKSSLENESKIKRSVTPSKIMFNEYQKDSENLEEFQKLENVESPYEFLRLWLSLKDDSNLQLHAKLLRCIAYKDINKIIGNKLDATMLSLILHCCEQQFCTPKDTELLTHLLYSLSQLKRFSIICMFMDSNDKKVMENILRFLEKENSPKVSQLRQIYT
ncbi:RNA polymerase II-associated protein 3 [Nylanderia fulva]|uniref:RNA polymerase II-associated protein 3 n=1 Tax=Nylanderia fulva TaxID=613905 RepID=UPI0010FB34C6|nr:RNA polymerase II-associated protein 3 [Nylanderia fulva]